MKSFGWGLCGGDSVEQTFVHYEYVGLRLTGYTIAVDQATRS